MKTWQWRWAAVIVAAILSACGGDGSDRDGSGAPAATTVVTPAKGVIKNATVLLYRADGSTELRSGDTGDAGTVDLETSDYNGPVVVEVRGDEDATYFDEATGLYAPFGPANSLFALAPAPGGVIAVTPLTHIAYLAAVRNGLLPLTAGEVSQLNSIVSEALAGGLDILAPPAPLGATGVDQISNDDAGRYALILAALAYMGIDGSGDGGASAAPALTVLAALFADAADGSIDGQDGQSAVTGYTNFAAEFGAALGMAASGYADADLMQEAGGEPDYGSPETDLAALDEVGNETPVGGGSVSGNPLCNEPEAATLNADLVGSYTLKYAETEAGAPFADGEVVSATVNADGSLDINGKKHTAPKLCPGLSATEVIWVDPGLQIAYALTDNGSGNFNEINVGDTSRPRAIGAETLPTFLGQLTETDEPPAGGGGGGGTVDAAGLDDLDAFTGNGFGITGTFASGRRTHNAGVTAVESVGGLINIMAFGALPTDRWEVTVQNQTGVQNCNSTPGIFVQYSEAKISASSFQQNAFTTANGIGNCQLEITKVAVPGSDNTIEGVFIGSLGPGASNTDTASRPVSRGAFRAPVLFQ